METVERASDGGAVDLIGSILDIGDGLVEPRERGVEVRRSLVSSSPYGSLQFSREVVEVRAYLVGLAGELLTRFVGGLLDLRRYIGQGDRLLL